MKKLFLLMIICSCKLSTHANTTQSDVKLTPSVSQTKEIEFSTSMDNLDFIKLMVRLQLAESIPPAASFDGTGDPTYFLDWPEIGTFLPNHFDDIARKIASTLHQDPNDVSDKISTYLQYILEIKAEISKVSGQTTTTQDVLIDVTDEPLKSWLCVIKDAQVKENYSKQYIDRLLQVFGSQYGIFPSKLAKLNAVGC